MLRLVDASWEIVAAAVAVASRFHSMLVLGDWTGISTNLAPRVRLVTRYVRPATINNFPLPMASVTFSIHPAPEKFPHLNSERLILLVLALVCG